MMVIKRNIQSFHIIEHVLAWMSSLSYQWQDETYLFRMFTGL